MPIYNPREQRYQCVGVPYLSGGNTTDLWPQVELWCSSGPIRIDVTGGELFVPNVSEYEIK